MTHPSIATPVVFIQNDLAITTSQDIARVFEKQHCHVLRAIENIIAQLSPQERLSNFGETFFERANPSGGAPIKSKNYTLTRDAFTLLAMGFTGKRALQFKLAYIHQFNVLEAARACPSLQDGREHALGAFLAARWLLTHDEQGRQVMWSVAPEQLIKSPEQFIESVRAGWSWSEAQLLALIEGAARALAHRKEVV